jgi:D-alanyl-D-alanine carboxypeptidase (penicillin-binding protein 5/6)
MTGTTAELIAGDVVNIEQLLYGLMLPSGNDAALALAKWAGALINTNPEEVTPLVSFILRMNKNAKILQLK